MRRSTKLFIFIFTISFCFVLSGCSKNMEPAVQQSPPASNDALLARKREDDAASKTYDELGKLVATVSFQLRPSKTDLENGETDLIPWIKLEKTEAELERLVSPDEVAVPHKRVTILIDYPLNRPALFEIESETNGFSRKQLAIEISKKYEAIYVEEEKSASKKTIPMEQRKGMINRNETDGKYGIWGHDLSDLVLSEVEVRKNSEGKIILVLIINS